ncbi:MAG: glycosyltransferase family 2 protein [Neisseriaceae bacterium]
MLSIVINVKNGSRYLRRCLNSLARFDNVVLLDNYSTDDTIKIAKEYPNVEIHTSEFLGMGKVRNLAASFVKYDWILFVDCDEVLSRELVNYLLDFTFEQKTIYEVRRYNFYNNYKLESSAWENDWVLRICNRNETQFAEHEVHESIKKEQMQIKRIERGGIYHFPYENVSGLINKMQLYSSLYAKQFVAKKKPWLLLIPFRAFFMFIKCYILKRGFLDGYEGFVVSSYNAIGVFSKYIKLYELQHERQIALAFTVDTLDGIDDICNAINQQLLLPVRVVIFITNNKYKEQLSQFVKSHLIVESDIEQVDESQDGYSVLIKYLEQYKGSVKYIAYLHIFDLIHNVKFIYNIRSHISKNLGKLKEHGLKAKLIPYVDLIFEHED